MRHRAKTKQFNRDTNSRKALLVNLVRSLIETGAIVTTREKAKEVKRLADKLIHQAQTDSVQSRRGLHQFFGKRDVVNTLTEKVAPSMSDRVSGFTTLSSVGKRRGDNSAMVKLSLVKQFDTVGSLKKTKAVSATKAKAEKTTKSVPAKASVKTKKTAAKPKKTESTKKTADKPVAKKTSQKRKVSK